MYITVEELKSFITNTSLDDSQLELIIKTAEELINIELWDSIYFKTVIRRVDWNWNNVLLLENKIKEIEYIKLKLYNWYTNLVLDYIDWNKVFLEKRIPAGRWNVEIKYTKWYELIPEDFKQFMLFYCKTLVDIYEQKTIDNLNNKEIKSKRLESLSIEYFSPTELKSNKVFQINFDNILRKYKNFNLYKC